MPRKWIPWGTLDWILPRIPTSKLSLIGALAPEQRCLACLETLKAFNALRSELLFEIEDEASRYSKEVSARRQDLKALYLDAGGRIERITEIELLARTQDLIEKVDEFWQSGNEDLVVDISAMPKRFFFPVIKRALGTNKIRNLIATYTLADRYGSGALAEDPEPWAHIPTFGPSYPPRTVETVVVSVGFQAMNLPPLGDQQYSSAKFVLLVPVPGLTPEHHRVWEFLHTFNRDRGAQAPIVRWVDWKDTPEIFSHLQASTENGDRGCIFAPYGPKPISLAMLLFARLSEAGVYYTQPKVYSPKYSIGIRTRGSYPEIYAYPLKIDGIETYRI